MDPKLLPEAKKKINAFTDKLAKWLESSAKQEVYQFSLQLVPLSKSNKIKKMRRVSDKLKK